MNPIVRYTLLRFLVFFGILAAFYLAGLRGFLLLIVAALASTAVSYFVLNQFRAETEQVVQHKIEERSARAKALREAEDDDE